ncbi:MAG: DNA replication and repair protein RecF [Bacteriovoracaceae bacterium]
MQFYKLEKLQVTNFRNLNVDPVKFSEGVNCVFGQNGNGKTNLLEAVYFLCNKKSFRKNTGFPQIISVESAKAEILYSSIFETENKQKISLSGKVASNESAWTLNNKPAKNKPKIASVFINPFDSYAFHTIPSFRRNWVDQYLSLISKEYKDVFSKYNQSLKFRNNLLAKKPKSHLQQIEAIDDQLAHYSKIATDLRLEFIEQLRPYCAKTFKLIFEETHHLEIKLESKFLNATQEEIRQFYRENLEKDDIIGRTSYGIHRDDYLFFFDGFNSFEFCSLGQQKMSYLSLIFAYIELFRYKFSSYPIVLMDDVSGELDSRRWKNLIEYLQAKNFQVMITTANESFKQELEKIDNSNKLYVESGCIRNI